MIQPPLPSPIPWAKGSHPQPSVSAAAAAAARAYLKLGHKYLNSVFYLVCLLAFSLHLLLLLRLLRLLLLLHSAIYLFVSAALPSFIFIFFFTKFAKRRPALFFFSSLKCFHCVSMRYFLYLLCCLPSTCQLSSEILEIPLLKCSYSIYL